MKNDRPLLFILVFIALITLAALILYFLRRQSLMYGPEDTPEGVAHNYVIALQRSEYARAYAYLADQPSKPSFIQFESAFTNHTLDLSTSGIQFGASHVDGNQATLDITLIQSGGGPFNEPFRNPGTASLILVSGQWKIVSMPYSYMNWDWFQPQPAKPVAPPPTN